MMEHIFKEFSDLSKDVWGMYATYFKANFRSRDETGEMGKIDHVLQKDLVTMPTRINTSPNTGLLLLAHFLLQCTVANSCLRF